MPTLGVTYGAEAKARRIVRPPASDESIKAGAAAAPGERRALSGEKEVIGDRRTSSRNRRR